MTMNLNLILGREALVYLLQTLPVVLVVPVHTKKMQDIDIDQVTNDEENPTGFRKTTINEAKALLLSFKDPDYVPGDKLCYLGATGIKQRYKCKWCPGLFTRGDNSNNCKWCPGLLTRGDNSNNCKWCPGLLTRGDNSNSNLYGHCNAYKEHKPFPGQGKEIQAKVNLSPTWKEVNKPIEV
ncbi:hypothetical protein DFH28DRAFT_928474 [Melampsora americana]|nr:hypothetical protein DFH28DRAFT_928474 [Melampsora americana]